MKIELELYHVYELDAFASFSAALAKGKSEYEAARPKDTIGVYSGGLKSYVETQMEHKAAMRASYVAEAAEAPDASHIATQENSSVATPTSYYGKEPPLTPAEKKTRQRKSKDAPAVSILSTDSQGNAVEEDAIKGGSPGPIGAQGEKGVAGISTGEERVGPEDSPEVVAQDAADEAAETAATKTTLTLDDVRNALGEYVKTYGMEVTHVDGPKVISMVCGEGKAKVSDVPDDKIAEVVAGVREMIAKNPFGREKVAA